MIRIFQDPKTREQAFKSTEKGFALVVTLSLMILLAVISLGLLSLSTISIRSSSSSQAMAEARANARMAVCLAIGQLQLASGQDTRVTASSALLDPTKPYVTGVWRSWEGSDHDATGKPIVPDYGSKLLAGNPSEAPGGSTSGRFLGWLTSTTANTRPSVSEFPSLRTQPLTGFVPMVGAGSTPDPTRQVYLQPTPINGTKGGLAWWTTGENAKAMVNTERAALPSTTVEWQQRVRSNGKADPRFFGLQDVNGYTTGFPIPSTASLKLVNPSADLRRIHDLTSFSRGLLTNTATGGWRKDMSLMTERFSALPTSNLPFFTLAPGKEQTFSKAQLNTTSGNPIIYPWARYRNNGTGAGWQQVPPICSWSALVDYTQQYARLPSSGSASRTTMTPSFAFGSHGDGNQRLQFQDQVRRVPQIARIQWIYSIGSRLVAGSSPQKFNPGILVTPVLTLWNPYNVELSISSFAVNIQETAPLRFRLKVAGTSLPDVSLSDIARAGTGYTRFNLRIESPITLAPGATRIFSTTERTPAINTSATDVRLRPGYSPGGGVLFTFINKTGTTTAEVTANGSDLFEVDRISYDALTDEQGKAGLGIIYDILVNGQSMSAARMIYDSKELGGDSMVSQLYPPLLRTISAPISTINVVNAASGSIPSQPFAALSLATGWQAHCRGIPS